MTNPTERNPGPAETDENLDDDDDVVGFMNNGINALIAVSQLKTQTGNDEAKLDADPTPPAPTIYTNVAPRILPGTFGR